MKPFVGMVSLVAEQCIPALEAVPTLPTLVLLRLLVVHCVDVPAEVVWSGEGLEARLAAVI